MNIVIIICG